MNGERSFEVTLTGPANSASAACRTGSVSRKQPDSLPTAAASSGSSSMTILYHSSQRSMPSLWLCPGGLDQGRAVGEAVDARDPAVTEGEEVHPGVARWQRRIRRRMQ